jgi:hypothetical protein
MVIKSYRHQNLPRSVSLRLFEPGLNYHYRLECSRWIIYIYRKTVTRETKTISAVAASTVLFDTSACTLLRSSLAPIPAKPSFGNWPYLWTSSVLLFLRHLRSITALWSISRLSASAASNLQEGAFSCQHPASVIYKRIES